MKTEIKMKNKLHLLARKPILSFKLKFRVPSNVSKLSSVNPMFRLAQVGQIERSDAYKPH